MKFVVASQTPTKTLYMALVDDMIVWALTQQHATDHGSRCAADLAALPLLDTFVQVVQ